MILIVVANSATRTAMVILDTSQGSIGYAPASGDKN